MQYHQWWSIINLPMRCCGVPLGSMGSHFVKRLTEDLNGVPLQILELRTTPCVCDHNNPHNRERPVLQGYHFTHRSVDGNLGQGLTCRTGWQHYHGWKGGRRRNHPWWFLSGMKREYNMGLKPHYSEWTNHKGGTESHRPGCRGGAATVWSLQ